MLEGSVRSQDGVVRLDDTSGVLGSGINTELQLSLLAVVDAQSLHQESTETGTGTTTEGVEDEEALETGAVVCNASDLVKDLVDEFFADGVVTTGIVVGGVLLARDHLFRVEERAVRTSADLIDDIGLEIAVDGARDIFSLA